MKRTKNKVMNYANRDKMNLKLIQLVKPHEILYKTSRGETYTHHDERRIMWQKVAEEMNRLFKLKLHSEAWKTKWRDLRTQYARSLGKVRLSERRNPVIKELAFLKPHMVTAKDNEPGQSRNVEADVKPRLAPQSLSQPMPQPSQQLSSPDSKPHCDGQNADAIVDNHGPSSSVSYQEAAEPIEPATACFEITIEEDNAGIANATNDSTVTTTGTANAINDSTVTTADSRDEEGDKMFGRLIVGELRKMAPADQKEFKRNVTRLLYT